MKVEINDLKKIFKTLKEIDSVPLRDVEWFSNGQPVVLSEEQIEDLRFLGVGNTFLVEMGCIGPSDNPRYPTIIEIQK